MRPHLLMVRLGAMGDILHALPAAAALAAGHPSGRISWLVEPRWAPLLEGNPFLEHTLLLDRSSPAKLLESLRNLSRQSFDIVVDVQGLLKSAIPGWLSGAQRRIGYHSSQCRERAAALFYTQTVRANRTHVVDRNLEVAAAAGAAPQRAAFPLPPGQPEGSLPSSPFILANPHAGWGSKQFPLQHFTELSTLLQNELNLTLVLNTPPSGAGPLRSLPGVHVHVSGLPGLIHATRLAQAVVGLDSGPMHLAAALGKPG
ncbi:MAG: glycosyltransferase family 9 protein, partial [Acidobacteriia bacterium]|nr:glycosyltransferase family 9 protein [Terriglobia bacterium]